MAPVSPRQRSAYSFPSTSVSSAPLAQIVQRIIEVSDNEAVPVCVKKLKKQEGFFSRMNRKRRAMLGSIVANIVGGIVVLWDARTGESLHQFRAHPRDVRTLAFSPDGRTLATGGADGADTAFEHAAGEMAHIYLPWPAFNGRTDRPGRTRPRPEAYAMAKTVHPAWDRLPSGARALRFCSSAPVSRTRHS